MSNVAVSIHHGEDKYARHPSVITAPNQAELDRKVGAFLLDRISDEDVVAMMRASASLGILPNDDVAEFFRANASEDENPDNDVARFNTDVNFRAEVFEEIWDYFDFEPTEEQIVAFKLTHVAEAADLYDEHVCSGAMPWEVWHIHEARNVS